MTLDEKKRLIAMREAGNSYAEIADTLGISKNTIKTFFRRNRMMCENQEQSDPGDNEHKAEKLCINCGNPVIQQPGRKVKKFCSDICRTRWWNSHLDQVRRRAIYHFTCPACGKQFSAYGNAQRKYCSRACYLEGRYGGRRCR